MTFQLQRQFGNDYATDLMQARKYYGEMLDAYAKVENPDDEYLLHLSSIVGDLEAEWTKYLAMLDNRRQGHTW